MRGTLLRSDRSRVPLIHDSGFDASADCLRPAREIPGRRGGAVRQSYPSDGIDDVLAVIEMYASRLVAVAALLATLALGTGCGDGKQSSASRTPPGSATPTAQQGQPTATPTPVPSP